MEDKFTTYSPTTLAGEDFFVRWVLRGEYDEQWKSWVQRHPERQPILEEARRIVLALQAARETEITESGKNELWSRINNSILAESKKPARNNVRQLLFWAVSAAAAFALMVWINNLTTHERIIAKAGEQREVLLPEQSAVTLNAGSSIMYKENSFGQDRILRLEGEAFFKVIPGSTFTVETDGGKVTVMGTSFNVLSRNGRFEVSCYTGKVKVESGQKDQLILTTGQQSIKRKTDDSLNLDTFIPISDTPEWTVGRFNFENQPLSDVVSELERQYAVDVRLDNGLEDIKYTGLFETGNLDTAVYLITWPLHLKSSIKGKTVTISR